MPETLPPGANLRKVKYTFQALNDLAGAARQRCGAKVIGITGSVGKTSTKEMLRHVLSRQGATHATVGNLNNHWGVPLTLARMPVDRRFALLAKTGRANGWTPVTNANRVCRLPLENKT